MRILMDQPRTFAPFGPVAVTAAAAETGGTRAVVRAGRVPGAPGCGRPAGPRWRLLERRLRGGRSSRFPVRPAARPGDRGAAAAGPSFLPGRPGRRLPRPARPQLAGAARQPAPERGPGRGPARRPLGAGAAGAAGGGGPRRGAVLRRRRAAGSGSSGSTTCWPTGPSWGRPDGGAHPVRPHRADLPGHGPERGRDAGAVRRFGRARGDLPRPHRRTGARPRPGDRGPAGGRAGAVRRVLRPRPGRTAASLPRGIRW